MSALARVALPDEARRRTLLYVEDNPANLMLVEQIVRRHPSLTLISAPDAYRGLELARTLLPDIILMDINLPGLNGFEALERLLQDPATARIPVLAVSANALPQDVERGLKAGFFRYVTKPIHVAEFMEAVHVALAFAEDPAH